MESAYEKIYGEDLTEVLNEFVRSPFDFTISDGFRVIVMNLIGHKRIESKDTNTKIVKQDAKILTRLLNLVPKKKNDKFSVFFYFLCFFF